MRSRSRLLKALPILTSAALVLAACGSGDDDQATAAQEAAPAAAAPAAAEVAEPEAVAEAPAEKAAATESTTADEAKPAAPAKSVAAPKAIASTTAKKATAKVTAKAPAPVADADQKIYDAKNGVTDVGVTKDGIKLGSVNMHGMALGNLITLPQVRANLGAAAAINDRGGVLGRRLTITDCDDGPGEVSRAKACIKKLVAQDKIFSLVTGIDWATASIHDDLAQYKLPYVGAWAYSQTEWQDPYMFPTHMSMIHEAMAGAQWVKNVIKPKTYGMICLTSPEMQLACREVSNILDASGAKLVKKSDVSISETSMSSQVLAMRAANPDHVIHYVINPATMAKWMVEAAQQSYYPPKGVSGNHLAGEVVGPLLGKWAADHGYWTNTTYRLWGAEYMATMNKYARANAGMNHHITQSGYVGMNVFAAAAKQVGPNLTRERLMATLANGTVWAADASLDQRWTYTQSERTGNNWNKNYGQGREFIYKMQSTNTRSNPDGTPNGWTPDPDQFVIYTWK